MGRRGGWGALVVVALAAVGCGDEPAVVRIAPEPEQKSVPPTLVAPGARAAPAAESTSSAYVPPSAPPVDDEGERRSWLRFEKAGIELDRPRDWVPTTRAGWAIFTSPDGRQRLGFIEVDAGSEDAKLANLGRALDLHDLRLGRERAERLGAGMFPTRVVDGPCAWKDGSEGDVSYGLVTGPGESELLVAYVAHIEHPPTNSDSPRPIEAIRTMRVAGSRRAH